MPVNTFTPSEIASRPELFYGRKKEIKKLERSINQGSLTIQGPVGIGKSSLLSRILLHMEGFDSRHCSKYVVATAHRDIDGVDDAARLILEKFVSLDEEKKVLKVNLFKLFEVQSHEVYKNFTEGRHLAVLTKLLEREYLGIGQNGNEFLIIAIDEADKSPKSLTKLMRVVCNNLQQSGINNVRFVIAGVNPYFKEMSEEDPGIVRFFATPLNVTSMPEDEAEELIVSKLDSCIEKSMSEGEEIRYDQDIVESLVRLSGGHPHLIQLLGWHLIEREEEEPDGILDIKDLTDALKTICYEDRVYIYDGMINHLKVESKYDSFLFMIQDCKNIFPTRLERNSVENICDSASIQWFIDNNYITPVSEAYYGLVDEFIRVRIIMDEEEKSRDDVEREFLAKPTQENQLDFEEHNNLNKPEYYLDYPEFDNDPDQYFDQIEDEDGERE